MLAFLIGRLIGVIIVAHSTLFSLELPSVGHPATAAAVGPVMLAPKRLVFCRIGRAVDQLLLGQTPRCAVRLDGNGTFGDGCGSESPA